jgi:hypothetical protein
MKSFGQLIAFLVFSLLGTLYGGLALEVCYGLLLETYAVFPEMSYGMAVGVVLVSSFISEVGEIDHDKDNTTRLFETFIKTFVVPSMLMFVALVLSFIV